MVKDKYTAVWVSHSSIYDFLKCPRAYFLRNIYKDPTTGRKISLINPALALGQTIHKTLEALSVLSVETRFNEPLLERFDRAWSKISGEKGGFDSESQEERFKQRGEKMIKMVIQNHGPLQKLAVKIKEDLPWYWLSEKDNIILCGKIDWLEYLKEIDSVHIIDFKTGRGVEDKNSLQLPIYHLLVHNCQQRKVAKASYWYLDRNKKPTEQKLPNLEKAHEKVLAVAKKIKLIRQLKKFDCPEGKEGCRHCQPLEKILTGEAVLVDVNDFGQNVYILKRAFSAETTDSEIL
ncbi:PD-(D/E)XK nuclease family protein [Candidatus Microgenomates bacterium]|nr:PD-(D/E)XK nuclease family protein [Candidatus Microgenomates bacterium]